MKNEIQHEILGHLPFSDLALEIESHTWAGRFDGWFDIDSDGAISDIWLEALSTEDGPEIENYHYAFPKSDRDWLASNLRASIEHFKARHIAEALCERCNGYLPAGDPGPSQDQRL